MANTKRLRSVIHSVAHHSISGLCYLHPHLGKECARIGISSIKIGLMSKSIEPSLLPLSKEIKFSLSSLQRKLFLILEKEDIQISSIINVDLLFSNFTEYYPRQCLAQLVTGDGRALKVRVSN